MFVRHRYTFAASQHWNTSRGTPYAVDVSGLEERYDEVGSLANCFWKHLLTDTIEDHRSFASPYCGRRTVIQQRRIQSHMTPKHKPVHTNTYEINFTFAIYHDSIIRCFSASILQLDLIIRPNRLINR